MNSWLGDEVTFSPTRPPGGLNPYLGPWTKREVSHLLRRTVFGPNAKMIEKVMNIGLSNAVDELFLPGRIPERPLNPYATNDPEVPVGNTWVNADQSPSTPGLNMYRVFSLNSWYLLKLQSSEINILEKMVLFWHNHFVVSDIESPALFYDYFKTLESNALGNFKQLTKEITINAGMLRYLNGNLNTKTSLNENFARELLELFTIGKGELAGPGDYTTFTETDVRAITKSLTGWNYTVPDKIVVSYNDSLHDSSIKSLSHRFGNAVIPNLGKTEYEKVVDIIFQQAECSKFIARKLYRWFVHYHIDSSVESLIIEPMSQIILQDNYNVKNAIKSLLLSEHFYSEAAMGCMIKSPIDFIMSISNGLQFNVPSGLHDKYSYFNYLWNNMKLMGQTVSELPDVSGWKAFYQEPLYYRHWINGVSLQERKKFIDLYIQSGIKINQLAPIRIDVLKLVQELKEPSDINFLIDEITELLYTNKLTKTQLDYLKESILNGLPEYEWTVEYNEYIADPNNQIKSDAIDSKLRTLFSLMLNLPEFLLN